MPKEGMSFGQLVLLNWRAQSKEDYLPKDDELQKAIEYVDLTLIKKVSQILSCEKSGLIRKLLFEGIKDNPLPYHHLSVLGTFGEKHYFVISKGRAKEIIEAGKDSQVVQSKEYRLYAQKLASQLRNGYELRDIL